MIPDKAIAYHSVAANPDVNAVDYTQESRIYDTIIEYEILSFCRIRKFDQIRHKQKKSSS